jgi:hypothetical protein
MNSTSYEPSPHMSTTLKCCHPERSLARREANRPTQSKDPYHLDTSRSTEASFHIVVRFFDEEETEHRPVSSRDAAVWESPGRQCRVCEGREPSPEGTALSNKRTT